MSAPAPDDLIAFETHAALVAQAGAQLASAIHMSAEAQAEWNAALQAATAAEAMASAAIGTDALTALLAGHTVNVTEQAAHPGFDMNDPDTVAAALATIEIPTYERCPTCGGKKRGR